MAVGGSGTRSHPAALLLWVVTPILLLASLLAVRGHQAASPPPADAPALLAEARQQEHVKLRAAEALYQEAVRARPHDLEAERALTEFYVRTLRFEDARQMVGRLVSEHPGELTAWPSNLMRAFHLGRPDGYREARQAIQASITRHPDEPRLLDDLACLDYTYCSINRTGNDPELPGRIAEAASLLQKAASQRTPDALGWFRRGEMALVADDDRAARRAMEKALQGGPWDDPWDGIMARLDAGVLDLHAGDRAAGRARLEDALRSYEAWPDVHFAHVKPIREYILMTLHVFYGVPMPGDRLASFQSGYRMWESQNMGSDIAETQIRDQIPSFYRDVAAGDYRRVKQSAEALLQPTGYFTGCATQSLLLRHFETMVWMELGDVAAKSGQPTQATADYARARQIFPW